MSEVPLYLSAILSDTLYSTSRPVAKLVRADTLFYSWTASRRNRPTLRWRPKSGFRTVSTLLFDHTPCHA